MTAIENIKPVENKFIAACRYGQYSSNNDFYSGRLIKSKPQDSVNDAILEVLPHAICAHFGSANRKCFKWQLAKSFVDIAGVLTETYVAKLDPYKNGKGFKDDIDYVEIKVYSKNQAKLIEGNM